MVVNFVVKTEPLAPATMLANPAHTAMLRCLEASTWTVEVVMGLTTEPCSF